MRDRKEYHREYYLRKKEAANLGMSLVKSDPNGGENHVATMFKPPFDHVSTDPSVSLSDKGLNSLNRVKSAPKPLEVYIIGGVLIAFILANTGFLVNEQIRYYMSKGYTVWYSLFVALLTETAVILLSFLGASILARGKRFQVYFSLVLTIVCTLSVVYLGVDKIQSEEQKNSEIASLMRNEIQGIRDQLPDKPKLLPRALKKEEELRVFLQTKNVSIGSFETFVLSALRILSLIWNVVFASILAGIVKGRKF